MDDERILEREMRQIEQIRQLESEELQVEEVDDDDESSDADDNNHHNPGGAPASDDFTYDTSLAALHSYLGDVDDTHNRLAFLDGGAIFTLPMLYLEGVVLFPEATLPLRVVHHQFIAAVDRALTQVEVPYTIGVVRVYRDPDNGRVRFATVGSTAEIRQYRRLEDGSVNILARGQQRFRLKRRWMDVEGATCGEVQVIQEDSPLRTPREAVGKLAPLRTLQRQPFNCARVKRCEDGDSSEESFESELSARERRLHQSALVSCNDKIHEYIVSDDEMFEREDAKSDISDKQDFRRIHSKKYDVSRLRDAPRAFWPSWVYHMFDSYCLAQKAADRWKQIIRTPSMDAFVRKPDLLSFHIASKIPLSESTRQELLEIDGISYRLQREIELLESFDRIRCKTCEHLIAWRSDMLVMSNEGPLGAFVNPHGYVHEVMTFHKSNGLVVIGDPVKEYSWFPGYAWSIAECDACGSQIGWLFTATKKKLKPKSFWGIRSSQVSDDMR